MSITVTSNANAQAAAPKETEVAPVVAKVEPKQSAAPEVDETEDAETAEESDASEANEDQETESDQQGDEQKPKRKSGFQRRIDKLNKAKAEAERERDFFREQLLKGKNPADAQEKPAAKPQSSAGQAPDPNEFETQAEYIQALLKHERSVEKAEADARDREKSVRERAEKRQTEHMKRLEVFQETVADFDDALESIDDVMIPVYLLDEMAESDVSPQLMYELAKNREELERICSLDRNAAIRALGRFEERIVSKSSPKETPKPKTTSAPAPLSPVGGKTASGLKKSIHSPDISQADYEALRRQQRAKKA